MKSFTLKSTNQKARRGVLHTSHGDVQTPFFMPIATRGTIKASVSPDDIRDMGFELILSNTYHLNLRPGEELVEKFGGLAKFMGWNGPMLTDSGGFQAFSLSDINDIMEDGIKFSSHIDGSKIILTPESVVDIQNKLGVDVMMVLDECTPYPCDRKYAKASMERSMRWASRCKSHWQKIGADKTQHLFGIVQGSFDKELREESAKRLVAMDFPGYAIGGVVVDFTRMGEALSYCLPFLPEDKPRYVMGIGTPLDILEAVEMGVDMFDCVLPTRNARHGNAFTSHGEYKIAGAKYKEDTKPIDENCDCKVCKNHSRAYIRHLFSVDEAMGKHLLSVHNLHFYSTLMKNIRKSIENGSFDEFKKDFIKHYKS